MDDCQLRQPYPTSRASETDWQSLASEMLDLLLRIMQTAFLPLQGDTRAQKSVRTSLAHEAGAVGLRFEPAVDVGYHYASGLQKGMYYKLYVVLDVFSRYVVGWTIAPYESAALAKDLITDTCARQNVTRNQLVIHSDRGPVMVSKSCTYNKTGMVASRLSAITLI